MKIRPCAVFRPRPWMSEMKTSMPARFWPPLTMPNSDACLIELMVSPPALARPMIFAFDACACSRNDEKSEPWERMAHLAEHLAAVLQHHRLGVALEGVAEGVVGGQEEPGVAAGLDDRAAGAVGEHPGVVGPVDGVGRARLAGQVGRRRAGNEERLALLARQLVDRQRDRRGRHVEDRRRPCRRRTRCGRSSSRRRACSGGRPRRPRPSCPCAAAPKSSTAMRAARTEPGPATSA